MAGGTSSVSIFPEQFRAIGWVGERLYSVIFEIREDAKGNSSIWCLYEERPRRKGSGMKRIRKTRKRTAAEAIARLADKGKDVSRFFTNSSRMMEPIQRVNVDFTAAILKELDGAALELNISRHAVTKTLVRPGLDRHYFAKARGRKLARD